MSSVQSFLISSGVEVDGRGGAVLLVVKDCTPCTILPCSDPELEQITVSIGTSPASLCVLYRPPNVLPKYDQSVSDYIDSLAATSNKVMLFGDLNVPDINWDTLTGVSPFSKSLCEAVFHSNLTQLVDSPTHILCHSHNPRPSPSSLRPSMYNYAKAVWVGLADYLLEYDFIHCFTEPDIDTSWSCFKEVLMLSMDKFIRCTRARSTTHPTPCLRGPLLHQLKQLLSLKRRYKDTPIL
uniref:Endonuclease/exonuclease/phosphatase domain-containing protein n=1 Tax=Amphimedon queenslandica TaxID=400682 RepID=A0A1X7VPE3_AMPQE